MKSHNYRFLEGTFLGPSLQVNAIKMAALLQRGQSAGIGKHRRCNSPPFSPRPHIGFRRVQTDHNGAYLADLP